MAWLKRLVPPALRAPVRRGARVAVDHTWGLLSAIEDRASWPTLADPPPISLYCVMRRRNQSTVRELLASLRAQDKAHLHDLDDEQPIAADLLKFVRTKGPGPRMRNLQNALDTNPPPDEHWILLCDDDVSFVRGDPGVLCAVAAAAHLDLAQPTHSPGSTNSYPITTSRLLSRARRTRFVEVGPVVAIAPRAREWVLPFPKGFEMGWGLDVLWSQSRPLDRDIGVVDVATVRHLGTIGADYATGRESRLLQEHLNAAEVNSPFELATQVGRPWRPWQPRAPWLRSP